MAHYDSDTLLSGQYVLHTLISDFIAHVDKKVEQLLSNQLESCRSLTKDTLSKLLQRGEDPQFDQLLWSLGCVAEYCLPCLIDTLLNWYKHQIPGKQIVCIEKPLKVEQKSKCDVKQLDNATKDQFRDFAVEFVFCLVLIEILKQISVHPLPDNQVRNILSKAFDSFHASAQPNGDNDETRIISDLYGEMIGVLAQTKFVAVQNKFMHELLKNKEPAANTVIALIKGMKYFRVKMYPVENFETSFRFMQELATYSLDTKNREVKNALAGFFVEVLVPVAAAVKTEVNVPVLRDFVDSLYPTSLELSKRSKNKPAIFPLVTCLLCVSQKTFFLNNWHIFLDICLSTLKNRDPRLSRVALESLYRLLWVYMVRIKCESNTTTQARLQSIVKNLFPMGSRNVVPKDMPLNIFVKIIQFIALERLDFAMRDIILDLLSTSSLRIVKQVTLYPERMNIALRAFLVVTDSLQQKDGAPPMPSTMNVMPSGNTIRVKKTFLNKTLTEEHARSIGVLQYLKHVQRSLGAILLSLDNQVGPKLLQTASQPIAKSTKDSITLEQKPKIELFRTCIAALPRLMPQGLSHGDLLNMLCRLTVHVDDDLRNRAIIALQAFIIDFPALSEEVVASFLSFVQNHVTDIHCELVNGSLKIAASLLSTWRTSITGKESRTQENQSSSPYLMKARNEVPVLSSDHTSTGQSGQYAPIISRIEGFAIVYLCHSRNQCRKLALGVLKEVRSLALSLTAGKPDDLLCLDCFDQLCNEVSIKVLREEHYFQNMNTSETDAILSAGYERNFSSLIDLSLSWSETDGYHPWMSFMIEFISSLQASGMCCKTLSYCWSDMFMRLSQLQRYIEPFMTIGSKKATFVGLVDGEHTLTLFTHYLVFLCRSSLSNASVKHRQHIESAVPAGTPDWRVRLIHDRKRLDTLPSTLFRKMVEVLRSETFPPAFKECVIIGMGYTSALAFLDLFAELQHVLHEANESKKQENVRRRRKRENIRIFLLKLLSNMSLHKVLSKGIYKQVEKLGGDKKTPKEIIQDYMDDTRLYLEQLDKSETSMVTSFSSQQLNVPLSSISQMTFYQNTAALKEDMRLNFSNLVIHLIRNYPISSRTSLIKPATKRQLFHLFGSWYDKCSKTSDISANNSFKVYAQKMLNARCSVMCCGPIFDAAALTENGYLYEFLQLLLSSENKFVRHLGQESIVLLLHFNPKILHCLTWTIDKCYTSDDIVAKACFLSIAFSYHDTGLCNSIITTLTLTLFSTTDPDLEVSQAAEHLMNVLLEKYFPQNVSDQSDCCCSFFFCTSNEPVSHKCHLDKTSSLIYLPPRLKVTRNLAQHHPELTYYVLSEIFMRFTRANSTRQRRLLEIVHLWLGNVRLIPADYNMQHITDSANASTSTRARNEWGSEAATIFTLNNILYLTVLYRDTFETEIEMCWSVLSTTWHSNLSACLQYFSALYSVKSNDPLRSAIRYAVTCVSRKNGSEVLSLLLQQCLQPHLVHVSVEPQIAQPYYRIVVQNTGPGAESLPIELRESSSKKIPLPQDEKICRAESNDHSTKSVSPKHRITRKHNLSHRLSLQIPLERKSRSLYDQQGDDFTAKEPNKPSHSFFSGAAKLSSSMMSLSKAGTGMPSSDDVRFSTLTMNQPISYSKKHIGLGSFASKHYTHHERVPNLSCTSEECDPTLSSATSMASDLAHPELAELIMWRNHVHDSTVKPLPLHFSSFHLPLHELVCCDKLVGLTSSSMSCIFLSQIVISQSLDIDWRTHLPIVTLALLLNLDQMVLKEVPFYCRKMLAHIILEIVGKKVPEYLVSSVLSYTSGAFGDSPRLHSSPKLFHSQADEHGLGKSNPGMNCNECLEESINKLLIELVCDNVELWSYEDVSPKAQILKSIDKLSAFVESFTDIVEGFIPKSQFRKSLAEEAMKFASSTSFSHFACRSLQIFRALKVPIMPLMLNRLVHCLLSKIVYGTDIYMQAHVIEILLTLLQDCEFGCGYIENPASRSITMNLTQVSSDPEKQSPKLMPPKPSEGYPTGRTHNPFSQLTKAGTYTGNQPSMPKKSRKIHAHRRSGSVTLSKKMTVELLSAAVGPSDISGVSTSNKTVHRDDDSFGCDPELLSYQKHYTPANHSSTRATKAATSHNSSSFAGFVRPPSLNNESWEKHAVYAQMFWISTALLESDYEHEFLLAMRILEKVLALMPLANSENVLHIEQHFAQIKWKSFPGIQSLIFKGLTSPMTSDLTFSLLSSFTEFSHLHLISGGFDGTCGFAMNVVSVLSHMLDCFEDADTQCVNAAKRIAAVCIKMYSSEKKLQHLAHVMLLYADHTYEQSSSIWISVVAKYLHETFPGVIREQIEFLSLMLERGPTSMHFSCLRILHSLLFQSEFLLSNEQSDILFLHHVLKTVSKLINNTKLWKDALMILKLAVSRSSAIATPVVSSSLLQSASFISDCDRITLPGRTLTFEYNISSTPLIGRQQSGEVCDKRRLDAGSPTSHPKSSFAIGSWKKPVISQKRTHDRITSVAQICGQCLFYTTNVDTAYEPNEKSEHLQDEDTARLVGSDSNDSDRVDNTAVDYEKEQEQVSDVDGEMEDIVVLRNFDFLDEFDENDDGFTTGYQKSNRVNPDEVINIEDDPDTCNLTPFVLPDIAHDLEPALSEENSDFSDVSEQELASQTSGVVSQSWKNNSGLTKTGSGELYSSLVTISSLEKTNLACSSSCESIETLESLGKHELSTRFTGNEASVDDDGILLHDSLINDEGEESDSTTSDSITTSVETDNEGSCGISTRMEKNSKQNQTAMIDLAHKTAQVPKSSPSLNSQFRSVKTGNERTILAMDPPPITSDITSNLSAVPFGLSLQSVPVAVAIKPEQNVSTQENSHVHNSTNYKDVVNMSWKVHIASLATSNDSLFVKKTFDIFPKLFDVLCVDFCDLSKKGCSHLGGQLSKIAEHFSSMVDQLPSQIKCPQCFASRNVLHPIVAQACQIIHTLHEHLEAYHAKRESAVKCIETIREIGITDTKDAFQPTRYKGMGQNQLKLCRILYQLHHQLLLLLTCFNQLIKFCITENVTNVTKQLEVLRKRILTIEKTYDPHRDKHDIDILKNMKTQSVIEAEQGLISSISNEQFHLAIRQLHHLRQLWPETFGHVNDPVGDILVKLLFKHLESQSNENIAAILGSEEGSNDVCEKLMEVNEQIQSSLESLELNTGDIMRSPTILKKTHF